MQFITNIAGARAGRRRRRFRKIQNTPKWTLSGTLDYDTPLAGGRLNVNTTLSYRSKSQQFETPMPGLDQTGFALWDANLVWRSTGNRFELGLHGKNLAEQEIYRVGLQFPAAEPVHRRVHHRGRLSDPRAWADRRAHRFLRQPAAGVPVRSLQLLTEPDNGKLRHGGVFRTALDVARRA